MNENEIKTPEGMEQDYIDTIQKMRDNTVPKDSYNALKEENKKLLQTLVDGGSISAAQAAPKASADELRNKIFNRELSNLEYAKTALELRNTLIAEGKPDPFVPSSSKYSPDYNDYAAAEKVAEALQSCIDYADGDSSIFTMELQRITKDTLPTPRR